MDNAYTKEAYEYLQRKVQRLENDVLHYKELAGFNVDAYFASQNKLQRYEIAMQMALVMLEDNNLMNETYHQIHAILDNEHPEKESDGEIND